MTPAPEAEIEWLRGRLPADFFAATGQPLSQQLVLPPPSLAAEA
jgi:hypothetical protein